MTTPHGATPLSIGGEPPDPIWWRHWDQVGRAVVEAQGLPVSTSTAALIPNSGTQVLSSTAATTQVLSPPYVGARRQFINTTTSSALKTILVNSTAGSTSVFIGAANTALTFRSVEQAVTLFAITATRWDIVSNVGSVDCS